MSKDVRIKISKLGYDVKTAADYQELFNSSWDILKIGMTGSDSVSVPPQSGIEFTKVIDHNLGYSPAFLAFITENGMTTMAKFSSSLSFAVDSTSLYYLNQSSSNASFDIRYYIFRHDLASVSSTGEVLRSTGVSQRPISKDYVVKVAKEGKSITSTDLRDYTINSNANNLPIHIYDSFTPTSDNEYTGTATHNLGYRPVYYLWGQDYLSGGKYSLFPAHRAISDTNTITFRGVQSVLNPDGSFHYVILKDPLLNA